MQSGGACMGRLRQLLPRLRFFGPQSSGARVAAVQSFAVWYGTTACVHVLIHSRNTAGPPVRPMAAMSAFRQLCCQHNTPGRAFHQLRRWRGEFRSSLFDRCTLHFDPRNLSFACVDSNQRVDLSSSLYVRRCSCVFVWRICDAAPMLQESTSSEARIVSAFSVVLCCKVRVPSPRASSSRANISRTYKRKSSVHAPVSANAARFPANSPLTFRRCPGVSPSSTACSPPPLTRTSSVGPS